MRHSQQSVQPGSVQSCQTTQTALVSCQVSHAEVHHGVELGGEVEGQLLDQQVGEVRVLQLGETGRVSPGVEDQ